MGKVSFVDSDLQESETFWRDPELPYVSDLEIRAGGISSFTKREHFVGTKEN